MTRSQAHKRLVSRRWLLGALTIGATGGILAACGQSATPTTAPATGGSAATPGAKATTGAATPAAKATTGAAATPGANAASGTPAAGATAGAASKPAPAAKEATVVFYVWGGDPEKQVWTQVGQAFEKANPGLKADIQVLGSAFGQKLTASFAAGSPPDSFYSGGGVPFGSAKVEQLLPIDEYVKADNIDLDAYFPVTIDVYRWQGKLYALPIECGGHVIYFNQGLFDAAGQTTPDKLVADNKWTWDQLITTGKAVTKEPDQFGYAIGRSTQLNVHAWSMGGGFVDDERNPTKSLWDQEPAMKSVQYWYDLRHTHGVTPTPGFEQTYGGLGSVATQMASNRLSMAVQGAWERLFLKDVTFKYNIAMMPKGQKEVTEGYSSAAVGTSATKVKDATWQWVKFTGSEEGQKIYAGLISVPPLRKVAESDWFLSIPPVNNKVYLTALDASKPQIGFPKIQAYSDIVNPTLDLVDADKIKPEEACKRIHDQLTKEIFTGA